jgi:hypothetical protein
VLFFQQRDDALPCSGDAIQYQFVTIVRRCNRVACSVFSFLAGSYGVILEEVRSLIDLGATYPAKHSVYQLVNAPALNALAAVNSVHTQHLA